MSKKKIIYIYMQYGGYEPFEYESLDDIRSELEKRNISIGDDVSIGDRVRVGYGVSIGYGVRVGYGVSIGYKSSIGDEADIGGRANIGPKSSIGDRANIGHKSSIGDRASIGDGVSIVKTLFITGSRHPVCWYGTNVIHIGCEQKTIQEWIEQYEVIGIESGYSADEISEYKGYIDICKSLQDKMRNR